jgi:MFS family permease
MRANVITVATLLASCALAHGDRSSARASSSSRTLLTASKPPLSIKGEVSKAPHGAVSKNAKVPLLANKSGGPSMYWGVLHNWLYMLSIGFNALNMAYLTRQIADGTLKASPASIALSGNIEAVDRIMTFAGVGLLAALSDVHGRRPLMAWASLGFALTNMLQSCAHGTGALFLADFVDGISSCMTPVCQAYVTDCSPPDKRAANLGIFQGLSIGMAFVIAFPVGGVLGAKFGPRLPLRIAAGLQVFNAALLLLVTPESCPPAARAGRKLDLREANPVGALKRLFGGPPLLRQLAFTYALVTLARNALDAQFVNYASVRFGWSQQQTGPLMVLVGLMLAIAPRVLVPLLGLRRALRDGLLTFALGMVATGLAPTPATFVLGLFVVSIGCVSVAPRRTETLPARRARPHTTRTRAHT